ncbi:MAG TPA: tetratricopeptide repeat protein [Aggregatilineaceae bacterium]|nr:tetratricopeptide repeat protein [Aggregatilineaceae bacterium]
MRTRISLLVLVAMLLTGAGVTATAQKSSDAVHLVLSVESDGGVNINRFNWDVQALAPVYPGTSVGASDFLELMGRSRVVVLCTDLQIVEQLNSEVPRCNPYPKVTAFFAADDPSWTPDSGPVMVFDPAALPEGIDASAAELETLSGNALDETNTLTQTIQGLGLSAEAEAFAVASVYRTEGLYLDAIATLLDVPNIECQRPRGVTAPTGTDRPLAKSPVLYLRLGELYQLIGQDEDAGRYYECAAVLAEALQDPANLGLAFARWANLSEDPGQAIQFYQNAINNFATLGAADFANDMLEVCGSRNCTMP